MGLFNVSSIESKLFEDIIVSTDSLEIAKVAEIMCLFYAFKKILMTLLQHLMYWKK